MERSGREEVAIDQQHLVQVDVRLCICLPLATLLGSKILSQVRTFN